MCKVIMTDDAGSSKTFYVSGETPGRILRYCNINPVTKIIYMNGKELTKDKINIQIPDTGTVHLAVKTKTVTRV